MENTTKTWQQELAEMIETVPEAQKQRVHDFLMGALATGKWLNNDSKKQGSKEAQG